MVICVGFVHRYRGGVIWHDHWARRGFLLSISIRNRYDFAYGFLTWLFVVTRYIDPEVASFVMITGIKGVSVSL